MRRDHGFTLIETLTAAFILVVGVLSTLTLFTGANKTSQVTRQREAATSLARELTEASRSIPYQSLGASNLNGLLQSMPGLQDSAVGGQYTILRRGTAYTVATSVCTMDDSKDGGGSRPSGLNFCPQSVAANTPASNGQPDKNPEDYKRVTVTVSWTRNGSTRKVVQSDVINNPGSATGPAVRSLFVDAWAAPYEITDPAVASLAIKMSTSSKPTVINWTVDGTSQANAPTATDATGLIWQTTWNITGLDDGAYLIGGEAFNQYGISGPGRTETVTLNRSLPRAVARVAGGRNNFGQVEMEWAANTERDIVGYEVERTDAAGTATGQSVCSLASQGNGTYCVDPNPPGSDPIYYHVRAYDKTPSTGVSRPGPWSAVLRVDKNDTAPYALTGLMSSTAGGVVTLKWNRPSPVDDPDTGDSIAFWRIYRDGISLANRYDRWYDNRSAITWQDSKLGGAIHSYYITAVDTHYKESLMVGPVLGGP